MLKKFQITLLAALTINFVFPSLVFAKVFINEVAWMGNATSQYGEWVELYNDGSAAIDLKGAGLYEGGGKTLIINLTKSIAPNGYYLIARSTPSMPDPVGGLADDLGSFGGSGLNNSGEYLVLKSASGDILDSLDASSGWPAGDAASKQTMQLSGGKWITAAATPRAANGSADSAATSTSAAASSDSSSAASPSITDSASVPSAHSSQSDLSDKPEQVNIFASAGRDRLALADTPITFEEKLFNSKAENIDGGNVSWSFGDGQSASGKVVTHSYLFTGDYAVVMNVFYGGDNYVSRMSVKIVSANLAISSVTPDFVKIKNSSAYEANIGGWSLASDKASFIFPKDTIILAGKEIALANGLTGLSAGLSQIALLSPAKNPAYVFVPKYDKVVAAATSSQQIYSAEFLQTAEKSLLVAGKELAKLNESGDRASGRASGLASVASGASKPPAGSADAAAAKIAATTTGQKSGSFFSAVMEASANTLKFLKNLLF